MGIPVFEMVTKFSLLTELSKINSHLCCWFTDIYPLLQKNLQKETFMKLMTQAFPNSRKIHEKVDDVLNFITSCLNIVSEHRPCISQLQKHKIVCGTWEREYSRKEVNVWKKKLRVSEFNEILKQNRLE